MSVVAPAEAWTSALPQHTPARLAGDPESRGRAHAALPGCDPEAVRNATVGHVETARNEGLLDSDATGYLAAQRQFHAEHDPASLAELRGIAAGFGFAEDDLFAFLHLALLRVRKRRADLQHEGCSTWAVADGPDGPLLVKNRDISGPDFGVQRVMTHEGPDIATGTLLCVGSLGAPAGYSSGINSAGFALADTYVPAADPAVGWLRYFLMTRLLAQCRSVAAAIAMISAARHAGGGTLTLADASGAIATVEFTAGRPSVDRARTVWRTNHFLHEPSRSDAADTISSTSHARLAFLERTLPAQRWGAADAARLMATHESPEVAGPLLCAHRDAGTSKTLSCAIYACRDRTLHFSDGNPCLNLWTTCGLDEANDTGTGTAARH